MRAELFHAVPDVKQAGNAGEHRRANGPDLETSARFKSRSQSSKIQMTTAIWKTVAILPAMRGCTVTLPTMNRMTTMPMSSNKSRPMMVPVSQSGIWPRRG